MYKLEWTFGGKAQNMTVSGENAMHEAVHDITLYGVEPEDIDVWQLID